MRKDYRKWPLVSVCMPTRNVAEYLADCIRSIKSQTYKNWELVVVNDGSTDSTAKVLNYYADIDPRIRFITIPHSGIAKARNTAIRESRGEYIAVMDSDDVMYKKRLKMALYQLFQTNSDVFYSAYLRANEHGRPVDGILPPKKFSREETKLDDILATQVIPHVTLVAKRECFIDHPYNDADRVNDDMRLVLSWWKAGYKFCMSKTPLVMVRYHNKSTSATKDKEVREITEKLRKEFAE